MTKDGYCMAHSALWCLYSVKYGPFTLYLIAFCSFIMRVLLQITKWFLARGWHCTMLWCLHFIVHEIWCSHLWCSLFFFDRGLTANDKIKDCFAIILQSDIKVSQQKVLFAHGPWLQSTGDSAVIKICNHRGISRFTPLDSFLWDDFCFLSYANWCIWQAWLVLF